MLLLLVVGSFFSLSHPLSIIWLGPIYIMAVVPYTLFNKIEKPILPLSISLCVLIIGTCAAYHQYALLDEINQQAYVANLRNYLNSDFSRRNVILPLSDVSYILHPRFISDRFFLLCLAFIPLLCYKYDRHNAEFIYGIYTTVIILIVSFIPFLINLVGHYIPIRIIDRLLWNLPLPVVFGMGMSVLFPFVQARIESFSNSKWIRIVLFTLIISGGLLLLLTRSTYYRFRKTLAKEQQISNTEFEVYDYLNSMNLTKGTRVWAPSTPKKFGEYLPGFVYGVYPFSFRGAFDNRLDIPENMERAGLNRPDRLFYSELNGADRGVDCKWLLQYY